MKKTVHKTRKHVIENNDQIQNLSGELKKKFLWFIEYHPASRFNKNLRKMLMEFLMYDGAIEAAYLNDLLYDMEGLFDLLDMIETECKN